MLTLPEKILFTLVVIIIAYAAGRMAERILKTIRRGHGHVDWSTARKRLISVLVKVNSLQPVFRLRFWPSLFHGFVAWGFIYYLLVNLGDLLEGYLPGFHFLGTGLIEDIYSLGADILSVFVLTGMVALIIRRFLIQPANMTARDDVLLYPKARRGIRRD